MRFTSAVHLPYVTGDARKQRIIRKRCTVRLELARRAAVAGNDDEAIASVGSSNCLCRFMTRRRQNSLVTRLFISLIANELYKISQTADRHDDQFSCSSQRGFVEIVSARFMTILQMSDYTCHACC